MHIDVIDELSAFTALRHDWDMVYQADPEAQYFLSWQWLSDWLTVHQTSWFVLAAKYNETDRGYVAFLPIRMGTVFDKKHGFSNEIHFAGAGFSDYAGLLTRPGFEAETVPAFVKYLKRKVNWARFTMDNLMMSDQRRRLFLRDFDKIRFVHAPIVYNDFDGTTDHGICPSADLPVDWEEYVKSLSTNNRQKIRRLLRKVDGSKDYRIALSDADSFDENLTMLLDYWKIKWAPSKGADRVHEIAQRNYSMLARCAQNGTLLLPVFWHGDRPVAALATLIDNCKRSLLFFITGRDETYNEMPAGYLLHAYSIRYAIAHGFTTYDFLRGNEPYKYLFASQERRLRAVSVVTKTNRNLGGKLDPRGLPAMLDMSLEFENEGELADAELGYNQILEIEPDHALALYRFGRLMAEKGEHAEAKRLLTRSVAVEPEGDNAWYYLAQSLHALGENEAALAAYRETVKRQPQNQEAKELIVRLSMTAKPADRATTVWPIEVLESASRQSAAAPVAVNPDRVLQKKVQEIHNLTQDYFDRFVNPRPPWQERRKEIRNTANQT